MKVFLICLGFYSGFGVFFMVFGGFSWFLVYNGFELLTTKTTVKTKKIHQFWIWRDSLKMVVFFLFFLVLQRFW